MNQPISFTRRGLILAGASVVPVLATTAFAQTTSATALLPEKASEDGRSAFTRAWNAGGVIYSKGAAKRQLVVFAQPYCVYCRQLERALEIMDNVEVRTLIIPHAGAQNILMGIACAKDPSQAWSDWMLRNKHPGWAACPTNFEKFAQIARELGVTSTPTLLFRNGKRWVGEIKPDELVPLLDQSTA